MLQSFRKSGSNPVVWGILAILIVGLIGFGGRVSQGVSTSNIANVGGQTITTADYGRAMQRQMRQLQQQFGPELTFDQAMSFGVDQIVLSSLITNATLDSEAARLGISAGDDSVLESLQQTQAFQGVDGKFDKAAYDYALKQISMTPAEYDASIRKGTARDLIHTGVAAGLSMPPAAANTLLAFTGEKRNFAWVTLTAANLAAPVPAATEAETRTYFDANPDRFMSPEIRDITYVALHPEDLAGGVTVSDDEIKAAYEARIDEFQIAETRAVERLAFATEADAKEALDQINAGAKTFESLAAERNLDLATLDLGTIPATELEPAARNIVFGPADPGIYGPAPSLLGPALFRVNAIFAPKSTSLDEAKEQIRHEIALGQAQDLIGDAAARLDDDLAGGATLEEIASGGQFKLATLAWNPGITEGIGADPAFVGEAGQLNEGEVRDRIDLEDGGIAVLRLDAITPPAVRPFEDAAPEVAAILKAEAETKALAALADGLKAELDRGKTLADLAAEKGLTLRPEATAQRGSTIDDAPDGLVAALFPLIPGQTAVLPGQDRADVVQLKEVLPFDPSDPANATLLTSANQMLSEQAGTDLFNYFATSLQTEAGVTVNSALLQAQLAAFR